jgi:acyl carrier protein
MNEADVLNLISESLNLAPGLLKADSVAGDVDEWDSMGSLVLVAVLDRQGIKVEPQDIGQIQSVQGIVALFRKQGKLA